jgi:hypothetical protein
MAACYTIEGEDGHPLRNTTVDSYTIEGVDGHASGEAEGGEGPGAAADAWAWARMRGTQKVLTFVVYASALAFLLWSLDERGQIPSEGDESISLEVPFSNHDGNWTANLGDDDSGGDSGDDDGNHSGADAARNVNHNDAGSDSGLLGFQIPQVEIPHPEMPHVEIPHPDMPHVEIPHPDMPHVEIPPVWAALEPLGAVLRPSFWTNLTSPPTNLTSPPVLSTLSECKEVEDCSWTMNYSCPGQPEGAQGNAEDDGTAGFVCCCTKEAWKQMAQPTNKPTTMTPTTTSRATTTSKSTAPTDKSLPPVEKRAGYDGCDRLADVVDIVRQDGSQDLNLTRCALVGAAATLSGKGAGAEIDNHTAVIRVNRMPTESFHEDFGKRTDFLFLSKAMAGEVVLMGGGEPEVVKCDDVKGCDGVAIIVRTDQESCDTYPLAKSWGPTHPLVGCQHANLSTMVAKGFSSLPNMLVSTGMQAFFTFLPVCSELTLYGFGGLHAADGHDMWKDNYNVYDEHIVQGMVADGKWYDIPWTSEFSEVEWFRANAARVERKFCFSSEE